MIIKKLLRLLLKDCKLLLLSFFTIMGSSISLSAQTDVHGKIIADLTKQPLVGASVIISGTTKGTATNELGEFTLENVPSNAVLDISMAGYQLKKIKSSDVSLENPISLSLSDADMGEVIVTGYQNIKKTRFSGAAVKLDMEDIKQNGITDISRMLEGRAAGLSVQNVSGAYGSAPKIRIRGATSLTGENKPLWVVDGVVLEDIVSISNDQLSSGDPTTLLGSSVAGLNPNDIESFDILKDASATALYGARAMNGVIVITTKKGKSGRLNVNYVGNFSTQFKPNYKNFDIMNSADQMSVYAQLEREGFLNYASVSNQGSWGVYGKMYDLISTYDPTTGQYGLENTPQARHDFLMRYANANTDWFDILFKNQFIQEHSLSFSGGTDRMQNYLSLSFLNDGGWTIADKVTSYKMNFRNNYKISDKLSVGIGTLGTYRKQEAPGALDRTSNPLDGTYSRNFDINPFSYALNTSRALTAYDENGNLEFFQRNYAPFNIINELQNNKLNLTLIDVTLKGQLNYTINKYFRYEFLGAMRYVKTVKENIVSEYSNEANAYRAAGTSVIRNSNPFLYRDPDNPNDPPQIVLPRGGFYNTDENELRNYDIRNSIHYNQVFNNLHTVSAIIGQQSKLTDRKNNNTTGYGFMYDGGNIPFVDYRILKQQIESNFMYYGMQPLFDRFASFYGNAAYTYNNKYNIGATLRYDGSNRLGKSEKARWLPTYTFEGSWNIDREAFMDKYKDIIDYLKLRASYGLNASLGTATNADIILQSGITPRPYASEKETLIQLQNLANYDLTWEKNFKTNIGLDGSFFKNRINFALDLWKNKNFDLINEVRTSGIGGEVVKNANFADMRSNGVDIQVGGSLIRNDDWDWRINITMGYAKTKVTRAENEPRILDLVKPEGWFKEGYPVRSLFSIDLIQLSEDSGIPLYLNEDSILTTNVYLQSNITKYLRYEGPVDPPYTGGINNSLRWKGLELNMFFTYQAGNKIRLYKAYKSTYTDLDALPNSFYDRWLMPGDQRFTYVPAISDKLYASTILGYAYANYDNSQARVADGGFIRLKTVSLSYNIPDKIVKRLGMYSASAMLSAYNLWLIYSDPKLQGQDPEFFNAGGVAQPIQKQMTFTLRLGF